KITVYPGDGKGQFGQAIVTTESFPMDAGVPAGGVVADVNNDGKPDLLLRGTYVLGDGAGGFGAPQIIGPSDLSNTIAADFNGDGTNDLIGSQGGAVVLLLGQGGGRFGSPSTIDPTCCQYSVVGSDLNADGKPDFLTTFGNSTANGVAVYLG